MKSLRPIIIAAAPSRGWAPNGYYFRVNNLLRKFKNQIDLSSWGVVWHGHGGSGYWFVADEALLFRRLDELIPLGPSHGVEPTPKTPTLAENGVYRLQEYLRNMGEGAKVSERMVRYHAYQYDDPKAAMGMERRPRFWVVHLPQFGEWYRDKTS